MMRYPHKSTSPTAESYISYIPEQELLKSTTPVSEMLMRLFTLGLLALAANASPTEKRGTSSCTTNARQC